MFIGLRHYLTTGLKKSAFATHCPSILSNLSIWRQYINIYSQNYVSFLSYKMTYVQSETVCLDRGYSHHIHCLKFNLSLCSVIICFEKVLLLKLTIASQIVWRPTLVQYLAKYSPIFRQLCQGILKLSVNNPNKNGLYQRHFWRIRPGI